MEEILLSVNILPGNVVYIDDSPTQRADIKAAFPQMRVVGGAPNLWRHLLLWAPETQTVQITGESTARTKMVQAQVLREEQRKAVSNEEFLASLDIKMKFARVSNLKDSRFSRALELLNKTNQFNTTGKRWLPEDCSAAFASGFEFCTFEVMDRYTDYGLVGVLILGPEEIQQFVMSCRVMSLEAEIAAIAHVSETFRRRGLNTIFAAMVFTDKNLPCRDVYSRCGFAEVDGRWQMDLAQTLRMPAHITLPT
jgi:FkbH-like protein